MSQENGHDGDEDRVMASEMAWPEPWRLRPEYGAEVQARQRAERLAELRERFPGKGEAA